jgi:hypothetical protein
MGLAVGLGDVGRARRDEYDGVQLQSSFNKSSPGIRT